MDTLLKETAIDWKAIGNVGFFIAQHVKEQTTDIETMPPVHAELFYIQQSKDKSEIEHASIVNIDSLEHLHATLTRAQQHNDLIDGYSWKNTFRNSYRSCPVYVHEIVFSIGKERRQPIVAVRYLPNQRQVEALVYTHEINEIVLEDLFTKPKRLVDLLTVTTPPQ
jgi:hypothetical protein